MGGKNNKKLKEERVTCGEDTARIKHCKQDERHNKSKQGRSGGVDSSWNSRSESLTYLKPIMKRN